MIDEKKLIQDIRKYADEIGCIRNEPVLANGVLKSIAIIKEQQKIENTDDFKLFELHTDITLKSMTKDELIDYIHMLYHNWSVADERYNNVVSYAVKQEKSLLDKACEELHQFDVEETIQILERNPSFEESLVPKTIDEWKEELMNDDNT